MVGGEAREFGRTLEAWLDQIARGLMPKAPPTALELFQAFIEADAVFFECADDSDGAVGDAVRSACRYWLQAASRCETPPGEWPGRVIDLFAADAYGAREELLRRADVLFDEAGLRGLVCLFETRMTQALAGASLAGRPASEVYRASAALSLLSEALRDPDVKVGAVMRYSPEPNPVQRMDFVRAYLDVDRPADAMAWLQEPWGHHEGSRRALLAETPATPTARAATSGGGKSSLKARSLPSRVTWSGISGEGQEFFIRLSSFELMSTTVRVRGAHNALRVVEGAAGSSTTS